MLGYDFEMIYKKGKHNVVANALQGKKKKEKVHYVLFLFHNLIEWKKQ
jgi:hypothetical protein